MSVFGDCETPSGPSQARLLAITLKVFSALHDPSTGKVRVVAEAKLTDSDGTAPAGVEAVFFLNGKRLIAVEANEFGVASLDHDFDHGNFSQEDSELSVRVAGSSREAQAKFSLVQKGLRFSRVSHRWNQVLKIQVCSGADWHDRLEGLTVRVKAEPTGAIFSLKDAHVELLATGPQGPTRVWAAAALDDQGIATIELPDAFIDQPGSALALAPERATVGCRNDQLVQMSVRNEHTNSVRIAKVDPNYSIAELQLKGPGYEIHPLPIRNNLFDQTILVVAPRLAATSLLDVTKQGQLFPI